jgi:hypothetical protein
MSHAVKPVDPEQKAAAFISGAGVPRAVPAPAAEPEAGKTTINMRFDAALLRRIDRAARSQGITTGLGKTVGEKTPTAAAALLVLAHYGDASLKTFATDLIEVHHLVEAWVRSLGF